ncbi:metallophosphoesterase family protein [Aliarcobacter skirrowii]|uniref:metallophosphoesterase family protein n=1 Tax=Aliarcobacter skirrowii TaxID=28200 RepID=UPI0029A1502F|nr:metallophosphoesterase family protein [Aliarcobacter skirrowii]MDX4071369.1 metallophosphoesterase family protein [Aliarcobacter skirrowii]
MIALISDIHGNYEALKEVLKKIDFLGINEIYCLGDITGYYTQVNECCEELRKRDVKCILGNHDWYIISNTGCPRSKSANDCLNYQKTIITRENLDWLTTLPIYRRVGELAVVHGGWNDPLEEYLYPSDDYFDKYPNKYFASGHTHKQLVKQFGEKVYCNPGSVGQPRDKNYMSSFATFDGNKFELHRVDYNVDEVSRLMAKAGFDEYYYKRLKDGAEHFYK